MENNYNNQEVYQNAVSYFSKEIGEPLNEEGLDQDKLIYCYLNEKSILDYDCWVDFEQKLNQSLTYDEYAELDESIDVMIFEIEDTKDLQLLKNRLSVIRGEFDVSVVDDFTFFDDETTYTYHYLITDRDNNSLCESIIVVDVTQQNEDKSFEDLIPDVIAEIKKNAIFMLNKPYLIETSPLMQELVNSSVQSEHGMVFIDVDEYFDKEQYSDEKLEQLCDEIGQYNLDNYIEVSDYDYALTTGNPLITVYFGVGSNFNLSEPDFIKESLKDKINNIEENKRDFALNNNDSKDEVQH